MMSFIDRLLEQRARSAAQQAPRRGMLKALGGVLVGASTLPRDGHRRAGVRRIVITGGIAPSMAFYAAVAGAVPTVVPQVRKCHR